MMQATHIARMLGGEVAGRTRVLAPGPGHGSTDRSLSILLDPEAPDGFRVHSFADDPWQICKDHVRERLGLGDWRAGRNVEHPVAAAPRHRPADDADASHVLRRREQAGDIWRAAVPLSSTPAERYLSSRGLVYAGEALRWHPSCPFNGEKLGCMVALVRNIQTNQPQAVHRTAIDADAKKIDRLSLAPIAGGAVKLTDDADVTLALGIGEGIETTLSLARIVGLPVWATITAGNLAAFPVLAGIESLWIAVDNDASGTGGRASQACVERQEAAGVETITATPDTVGADMNDRVAHDAG